MATVAEHIYEYSEKVMKKAMSPEDLDSIKKRIVDSVFVAYGARNAPPVRIAESALLPSSGKYNSRIYFSARKASVEVAAFINGSMTRYLDYNDTYLSREALHPSDNIPPILCCAESMGIDGDKAIRAIKVAYQVVCSLADAVSIRDRGWDHVTYVSLSSAAGLATLVGLERDGFSNAISLGINNNISMRQTRAGELSMWKGCTVADAGRNSVFGVLLAKNGMTGPAPIFEGEMGFFRQVSGKFKISLDKDRLQRTMIKNHPVEYHAMSGVDAALKLKNRISGKINSIEVDTFSVANSIIIKDRQKWIPKTKETADHSLPYIIAYTLVYGAPNPGSYSRRYLSDKRLLEMIRKMRFNVTRHFDDMYPDYLPIKIKVSTTSGVFKEEVLVPKGHFRDTYSWEDLRIKGLDIIGDQWLVKDIIDVGRSLERRDVSELFDVIGNVNSKR